MIRNAEDDFAAMRMANAMELAGAVVIAITVRGTDTYTGALAPHQQFTLWARVRDDAHIGDVDAAIEAEFGDEE